MALPPRRFGHHFVAEVQLFQLLLAILGSVPHQTPHLFQVLLQLVRHRTEIAQAQGRHQAVRVVDLIQDARVAVDEEIAALAQGASASGADPDDGGVAGVTADLYP